MKKKISILIAGLGLCASLMFINLNMASAGGTCTNTCKWDGSLNKCAKATMGCWCGSGCELE